MGSTRVLVWSELFWPYVGGAELFVASLILKLRERGYEFLVATSHDNLDLPDKGTYEGIPIHRFPFRAAISGRDLDVLREAMKGVAGLKQAYAPCLLHASGVGSSLLFHLRTIDAHRTPWLVALQQEVLPGQSDGRDTLLYQAMQSASWVTACSEAVLAQARRLAPEIEARSSVIRNGVGLTTEPMGAFPPKAPRLLCVGRLVPAKGFDVALAAFATLVARFPALRLTVAGDGLARHDLERQAAELGLESAVEFLGWVHPKQVLELIDEVTVVVMPSRREGLPLAALEAALMARPIVATRVGGLPELIVHNETGMLVERDNARGLAEVVAFLLEHPDEAARIGRAARAKVRETLSLDRCVDAYDDVYRTLTRRYAC